MREEPPPNTESAREAALEAEVVDTPAEPRSGAADPSPRQDRLRPAGGQDDAVRYEVRERKRRRITLPLILFIATCLSCFWVGVTRWEIMDVQAIFTDQLLVRRLIVRNWDVGLTYTACVLAILLTHEMGHFLATVRYRIPATLPLFLPFPTNPIGTLGAVIAMDGMKADRKEMFDIGIAGPLAGLAVAVPILIVGVRQLDLTEPASGILLFDMPLLAQWLFHAFDVPGWQPGMMLATNHLNAYFMAGWFGLLITGLNMFPVSQLDGGHVIYALFGKTAHVLARAFVFFAIALVVLAEAHLWWLMLILVILLGTDHPPTRNDNVKLGPGRIAIGWASLVIPVLCFPPVGLKFVGM